MRTCIITGSNSGIGKCAAAQLAGKGFRVIMACRNVMQAEAVCDQIRESSGNEQVFARKVDLSLLTDTTRFADDFAREFGALDVLINNAADFDISRKYPSITPEGNEAQFATNLLSPFVLMNKLQPLLQAAQGARIINISSKGLMVFPNLKFDFDSIHGEQPYSPTRVYPPNDSPVRVHCINIVVCCHIKTTILMQRSRREKRWLLCAVPSYLPSDSVFSAYVLHRTGE